MHTKRERGNKHIYYLYLFLYRFPYFGLGFGERILEGFYGLSRFCLEFQTNRVMEMWYESGFFSYFHIIFYTNMIQNKETGQCI